MSLVSWSPDHEYETIKVYFNGKEYNMKDKKDRKKLKEIQYEEKYKTKMAKMMDKYGIPQINKWVTENPNTLTRLAYELYLEEERNIAFRQIWAYILLGISLVLMVVSFFIPGFLLSGFIFLFVSSDIQTNLRIDKIEQKQWRDMIYNMYRGEKEEKNVEKHSEV